METLYENPIKIYFNNTLLTVVKVCSNFIFSPFEMIFMDDQGKEVKYAELDVVNKKRADRIFNQYRLGRLKFAR